MGIYKRKKEKKYALVQAIDQEKRFKKKLQRSRKNDNAQEKKGRKHALVHTIDQEKKRKKVPKQELDQEGDQDKKKVFFVTFLVESVFILFFLFS